MSHSSVAVQNPADRLQLQGLGVIDNRGRKRKLLVAFFAHFVAGSFLASVVILDSWQTSLYYISPKNANTKCAFFIYFE
jgi:hypothetical protein